VEMPKDGREARSCRERIQRQDGSLRSRKINERFCFSFPAVPPHLFHHASATSVSSSERSCIPSRLQGQPDYGPSRPRPNHPRSLPAHLQSDDPSPPAPPQRPLRQRVGHPPWPRPVERTDFSLLLRGLRMRTFLQSPSLTLTIGISAAMFRPAGSFSPADSASPSIPIRTPSPFQDGDRAEGIGSTSCFSWSWVLSDHLPFSTYLLLLGRRSPQLTPSLRFAPLLPFLLPFQLHNALRSTSCMSAEFILASRLRRFRPMPPEAGFRASRGVCRAIVLGRRG
jgi:hypothetical protein